MTGKRLLISIMIVCVVQTIALANMVYGRAQLLNNGTEILLKTRPIDPRSLFRGHYVRLNYMISSVSKKLWLEKRRPVAGEVVYLNLKKDSDDEWAIVALSPTKSPALPGQIVLRGKIKYTNEKDIRLKFGINRFYLPKKTALRVEGMESKVPIHVVIAISPTSGEAAIKALMIDGKRVYEQKIF